MAGLEVLYESAAPAITCTQDALICFLHWEVVTHGYHGLGTGDQVRRGAAHGEGGAVLRLNPERLASAPRPRSGPGLSSPAPPGTPPAAAGPAWFVNRSTDSLLGSAWRSLGPGGRGSGECSSPEPSPRLVPSKLLPHSHGVGMGRPRPKLRLFPPPASTGHLDPNMRVLGGL